MPGPGVQPDAVKASQHHLLTLTSRDLAGRRPLAAAPLELLPGEVKLLLSSLPHAFAKQMKVLPYRIEAGACLVFMSDPYDVELICKLEAMLDMPVVGTPWPEEHLAPTRIDAAYFREAQRTEDESDREVSLLRTTLRIDDATVQLYERKRGTGSAGEVSVDDFIKLMVLEATSIPESRASDIHLEPSESTVKVRFRIDGYLFDHDRWPGKKEELISRIKILSRMDIAEKRKPQDGGFHVQVGGKMLDIRASTLPIVHGEKVVLRLLDPSSLRIRLDDLGFERDIFAAYWKCVTEPFGLVLLTGPTGSGKTTTLYSSIYSLLGYYREAGKQMNIVTLEDPIEYRLDDIFQSQVVPQKGFNFATGLRSILRQDPNVILIGEIRDEETAQMAIQASLTGHMVFSTVHTNDATGIIPRLMNMGVSPHLIRDSVRAAMAQRLVRRICPACSLREIRVEALHAESESLKVFKFTEEEVERLKALLGTGTVVEPVGSGCPQCKGRGFRGRIPIVELLDMSTMKDVRFVTEEGNVVAAGTLRMESTLRGMRSLLDDGLMKAKKHLTSLGEVLAKCPKEQLWASHVFRDAETSSVLRQFPS